MKKLKLLDAMSYGVGEFQIYKLEEKEIPDDALFMKLVDLGCFEETPAMASYHVRTREGAYNGFFDGKLERFTTTSRRITRRLFSKLPFHEGQLERVYPGALMPNEPGAFSVLVTRDMGAGDVLIATDLCYQIKKRFPLAEITFATLPAHRCLLEGNPDLAAHATIGEVNPFDFNYDVYLPRKSETAPDARSAVRTDIYLREAFGEAPTRLWWEHHTRLCLRSEESVEAWQQWESEAGTPPRGARRVVIQPRGSGSHRSLDPQVTADLIAAARAEGWWVAVIGTTPEHWGGTSAPGFANLCGKTRDVRQAAAVISAADLFIGPDSSGYHMAAALSPPVAAYVLFTTVDPALRIRDYHTVRAAIGGPETLSCRPCADHISCGGRLECVRQNDGAALWERARSWFMNRVI